MMLFVAATVVGGRGDVTYVVLLPLLPLGGREIYVAVVGGLGK
jgi:hypothetical protein